MQPLRRAAASQHPALLSASTAGSKQQACPLLQGGRGAHPGPHKVPVRCPQEARPPQFTCIAGAGANTGSQDWGKASTPGVPPGPAGRLRPCGPEHGRPRGNTRGLSAGRTWGPGASPWAPGSVHWEKWSLRVSAGADASGQPGRRTGVPSVQLGLDLLVAGVDVHRPQIESQPGIYPSSQLGCSGKGAWDDPQPCTQTVPAP